MILPQIHVIYKDYSVCLPNIAKITYVDGMNEFTLNIAISSSMIKYYYNRYIITFIAPLSVNIAIEVIPV